MLVQITEPVKQRIRLQIQKLCESECRNEFKVTPREFFSGVNFGKDEDRIVELLFWGSHLEYRDRLPQEWFEKLSPNMTFVLKSPDCKCNNDSLMYTRYVGGTSFQDVDHQLTVDAPAFKVQLSRSHLTPYTSGGYRRRSSFTLDNPDLHPALRAAYDKAKNIITLCKKWRDVTDKVNLFLGKTKSVNEAVKVWPEFRTFLDPEDVARLDKKQAHVKKARESRIDDAKKVLTEIDTQSIVADIVGIKLSAA